MTRSPPVQIGETSQSGPVQKKSHVWPGSVMLHVLGDWLQRQSETARRIFGCKKVLSRQFVLKMASGIQENCNGSFQHKSLKPYSS